MVVGSRRNWFTIISFLGLFNRPRRTFISFYQKASVLWFAKYWQPIVVYTRQERGFSQNTSRNSGGCFHFLSVWIWCFFFYCTGKRELAIVCEGVCSGSLATGVKCCLVYVGLFSVLIALLILLFRLKFRIHILHGCCPVIFTLHLLVLSPLFYLYYRFYRFLSLFFFALFFRYFVLTF